MNLKLVILVIFTNLVTVSIAQKAFELPPPEYIKTVQFEQAGVNLAGIPLVQYGSSFEINFDDIMGDEAFYHYKISYYDYDWSTSILPKNEYLDGLDNFRIQNSENSLTTLQIYTHYRLQIPNKNVRRLLKTGNYLLEIYNDDDELVFTKKFIVYRRQAVVKSWVKRSRKLNFIREKQVVQFEIETDKPIIEPQRNLKVMVMQNHNLKTAIYGLQPQFNFGNKFTYKYDQESSFWGGNEYWGFDNKEIRNATNNISHIELKNIYHNYLFTQLSRKNRVYTFNPDINGNYVVRNLSAQNNDIEADYAWIHFALRIPKLKNKEIHIYGGFNDFEIDDSTILSYNPLTRTYEGQRLFKQGFYNFKYVTVDKKGNIDTGAISGNFDKTENEYTVLVYYRAPGQRNDSVIGLGNTTSVNISN